VTTAIATVGLRKEYPGGTGLHGIDLDVPEGAVYGLVGPNGAGKTTLLCVPRDSAMPTRERDDRVALDRFTLGHALPHSAVLGVGDVLSPCSGASGDGDVGHEVVVGRAVPVLLTVGGDMDVAGADLDDILAA